MIYDCFTFFNEFELLELRLRLLYNSIDYFVVVESNKTFQNKSKEFEFEKNKIQFKQYSDKIIYIKVDDMPRSNDAWELEYYQRNCIAKGLEKCSPEDIIIISDIDEIPNPEVIKSLLGGRARVNYLIQKNLHRNIKEAIAYPKALFTRYYGMDILERTPISFRQNLYYYFVNLKSRGYWNGSIITKFKNMTSPQQLRDKRNRYPRLINGGWHFSYLGGVDRIILKLNSFSETQPNNPKTLYSGKIVSHDYIKNCIENGEDIYGRKGKEYEYDVVNVDDQFPKYVHTLIQKYPYLYFDKM